MTTPLELEEKYRVTVGGAVVLLPYTLAKKQTVYAELCIFHDEEPAKAAPGSHLCPACIEWLRSALTDVAKYWPDLEDALAPAGGRAASAERVGGTGDLYPPLPINGEVSDIMRAARRAIWLTVGKLIQDRPEQRLPLDHGTGVLADWLARWHVEYLATHPSVEHVEAVGWDLAKIARQMREAAYQSPPIEVDIDGNCHQLMINSRGERVPCTGKVSAWTQGDGRVVIRCSLDITHRVPADQWFATAGRRTPRPNRAMETLKKKYLTGRKA
ncbi:hypothetical protein J7I84_08930 [Arthrobacter sp. ISL-85]|uniref:hypothetical protein n=1 Tax=Arthrobacter sp. ISL-85 TaxID=2819115 RepID=UPI001BEC3254|nr:hypothetical protein [Arthrobacter sp. ISL-85]MBT2566616.1 hypothetical protein [Arthrobacter sp. ISL-85]